MNIYLLLAKILSNSWIAISFLQKHEANKTEERKRMNARTMEQCEPHSLRSNFYCEFKFEICEYQNSNIN